MKNITNLSIVRTAHLFSFIALSIFLLFISSCKDNDLSELKNDKGDKLYNYTYIDSSSVVLKTIEEDSLRSDGFTRDLIGAYQDNNIGFVRSSIFFEVRLPSDEINPKDSNIYKSIQLNLKYYGDNSYFGNLNDQVTFKVYEISERIYRDSNYFSNDEIPYYPTEIGSFTGYLNPTDTTYLSIPLSDVFGQKLFNEKKETYQDNDLFHEFFKGFAIIPEIATGNGIIGYFDLEDASSTLSLIYNDTDHYDFLINSLCARFNKYEHNYTGSTIETQLKSSNTLFDEVYLLPLAGVKVKVMFPFIKSLVDSGIVAIHKAEIIFKPNESSPYFDELPKVLLLLESGENNENYSMIDRYEDHYGGRYNEDKNQYSFVITRYLQSLLSNYHSNPNYKKDFGLNLIVPSDNPIIATPVVIDQLDDFGGQNVKLRIYYTKP